MAQSRHFNLNLTIVALSSLALMVGAEPNPWAENVCNQSIPVKEDIIIEQPVRYEIKVQGLCGILPCMKTRLETRTDQTIKTIVKRVTRATCCPGYAETSTRQCAPICLEFCNNGAKCVAPNVCQCQPEPSELKPGFVGPTCNRYVCLLADRWGSQCERKCQTPCSENSYCSADTGKCLCYPGWHGPNCDLECDGTSTGIGCDESNKLPPIIEPDANLFMDSSTLSRSRKAEALTLGDDDEVKVVPEVMSEGQAWSSFASSYLIGLLSVMSLILLVAFLIVKRRYQLVRNELYYASAAATSSGSSNHGSYYSGSSYSSTVHTPSSSGNYVHNLDKNLSFAAATRNILSGALVGDNDKTVSPRVKGIALLAPRVESHLIMSQEVSKQNLYSEIDMTKGIANRSRAETPTMTRKSTKQDTEESHIYQVPKMSPFVASCSDESDKSKFIDELNQKSHETSVEIYDDDDPNIYEEIKPRGHNL